LNAVVPYYWYPYRWDVASYQKASLYP
jgi:hypothetical protein